MAEGVDQSLADGIGRDFGNLLALQGTVKMNAPVDIAHDVFFGKRHQLKHRSAMTLDVQKRQPLRSREDRHLQLCVHTLAEQHHARVQQMLSLGQQQLIQRRGLIRIFKFNALCLMPALNIPLDQLSVYLLHKKV